MTRANLNFVWQACGKSPQTVYHYHNGDQYPQGLRDSFNVLDFFQEKEWTPETFRKWVKQNYSDDFDKEYPEPVEISHPCIYYDNAGFITDYSYVFENTTRGKWVKVFDWDEKIFDGSYKKFIDWIKKQKD